MQNSAILERFRAAASRTPERVALIGSNAQITYSQLERQAASAARQIAERAPGDVVALLLPNTIAFAPLLLGAIWAGKTVAVLPTLAPPPLLKLMAMEAGAQLIITSEEFVPRLMEQGLVCWIGEFDETTDPNSVPATPRKSDVAVLLYTSGTTGRPKTVALSEENILANIDGCKQATGFSSKEVMLAILPLFHAYGLTVTTLLPVTDGATTVIPDRFIPRQVLQWIEQYKISCLIAVPSQFRLLTKEPTEIDASSLWLCIAGGERLPEHVAIDFEARFHHPIVQGYGTTELSPVISLNMPETNRLGSVGKPLPNINVTILDENGRELPSGEVGEVCVSGPSVMLRYLNDSESTGRKIQNGVLHTGDKGYLDAEGYLFLVGRADDLVKVSGEKVYPAEVENMLETIEGVDEVAVVAFPDEKHGARLHAFIQPRPGVQLNEANLRAQCRDLMEHYKIPRTFSFIEQMPRTLTGKTDKRTLMANAVS